MNGGDTGCIHFGIFIGTHTGVWISRIGANFSGDIHIVRIHTKKRIKLTGGRISNSLARHILNRQPGSQ
jgi:hypothetical protein